MTTPRPQSADFDAFYSATARRLVGQVYALTGDLAEAEDAVAEAFVQAWYRWASVSALDSPEAWVRRVAFRRAVSAWRKAVNRLTAHRRAAGRDEAPGPGPDRVALLSALRSIPNARRQAIVLHHLVGLSVQEIATEVGSPPGTVKARLSRGRAALASHLSDPTDLDRTDTADV